MQDEHGSESAGTSSGGTASGAMPGRVEARGEAMSGGATDVASGSMVEAGGEGRPSDNRPYRRQRHRDCYCRGRNKSCPKCGGTGQLLPNWRENLQAVRSGQKPVLPGAEGGGETAGGPATGIGPAPQPMVVGNDRGDRGSERNGYYDRGGAGDRAGGDRSGGERAAPERGGYDRQPGERTGYDRGGYERNHADRGPYDRGGYDRGGSERVGGERGGGERGGGERGGGDRQAVGGGQDRPMRQNRWQNRNANRPNAGYGGPRPNQKVVMKMCPMCGEWVPNLRAHVLARHDD